MGRKNRNARSRSYSSFADLKTSTMKFDLSKGNFSTKRRHFNTKAGEDTEIRLSLVKGGNNQDICVSLSIRQDIKDKLGEEGNYWTCGIVKEGMFERLYIIPDEYGYALYTNKHGARWYVKIPIDNKVEYEKYVGKHELQYDDVNNAWFMTANV